MKKSKLKQMIREEIQKLNEIQTGKHGNGSAYAKGKYITGTIATSNNPNGTVHERWLSIGITDSESNRDWIKGKEKLNYGDDMDNWDQMPESIMKEFSKIVDTTDKAIDKLVKKYLK